MSEIQYYVVDDMKQNFNCEYFTDIRIALERFEEAKHTLDKFPSLGIQVENSSLDLLHGINGEAVLVPDYRKIAENPENWSAAIIEAKGEIQESVNWLVNEKWCVAQQYQNSLLPNWLQGDVKILVPVSLGDEPTNSYCNGKVLKTTLSTGLDAIDSFYIEGHGWVTYNEFLKNPDEYVSGGVIKVPMLNAVYVYEKNVVGIDGRMDIAPHDFAAMVHHINKPYSIVAYDAQNYNYQYKDKHDYIVASFDDIQSAVKKWYDIQETNKGIPLYVQSRDSGELVSIFNGMDKDLKDVEYSKAVELYDLKADKSLEDVLRAAVTLAESRNQSIKETKAIDERNYVKE